MAPGIASGSNVGVVGGAFLLKSKTEKPMEPLSRNPPSFPRHRGTEVRQTPEPSPQQELVTQSCAVAHIRLPRTRLPTG